MSRRQTHRPHHESPHEARLREVVCEMVPDPRQRPVYLRFARELDMSLRRPLKRQAQAQAQAGGLTLETGNWKLGTATTRNRHFPDFRIRTKRVVARWFRRGLSGRAMWRIGQALFGRVFPAGR
jgi:hypothetical protein